MRVAGVLKLLNDCQGLLYFLLVMEVHLYVYSVAADVVEQRAQFGKRHPAGHNALATGQYLLV